MFGWTKRTKKAGSTDKKNPLDAFNEEIQNWPEQDAKTAFLLLALSGSAFGLARYSK